MQLCNLVQENSRWVWNTLECAKKLGRQIGEESITDFLVLNMRKWARKDLVVNTFTKQEEFSNGADWELWLTGPSGKWLGIRLQAKIIHLKSERFKQLHRGKRQVKSLIDKAKDKNLLPLYCMYSNWDSRRYEAPEVCKTYEATDYHYGTSILSPFDAMKIRKATHIKNIINYLKPMHCIFCCGGFGGCDLPTRALKYIQGTIFKQTFDDIEENADYGFFANPNPNFLTESPPNYVTQLVSNDFNFRLSEDEEFMEDKSLMRVTVVKERKSSKQQ